MTEKQQVAIQQTRKAIERVVLCKETIGCGYAISERWYLRKIVFRWISRYHLRSVPCMSLEKQEDHCDSEYFIAS